MTLTHQKNRAPGVNRTHDPQFTNPQQYGDFRGKAGQNRADSARTLHKDYVTADLPAGLRERVTVAPDGCWLWTGTINHEGYGKAWVASLRQRRFAHRLAYEAAYGPIPDGRQIDHLCRVRPCINPAHLEAVTPRVNTYRSESFSGQNARKTHCDHGHELAGENLRIAANGSRHCIACQKAKSREHYERYREVVKARSAARRERLRAERGAGRWLAQGGRP